MKDVIRDMTAIDGNKTVRFLNNVLLFIENRTRFHGTINHKFLVQEFVTLYTVSHKDFLGLTPSDVFSTSFAVPLLHVLYIIGYIYIIYIYIYIYIYIISMHATGARWLQSRAYEKSMKMVDNRYI